MTRRMCTLTALTLMYVQTPGLHAQDVQTGAYRNSIEQEDIKRDTERTRQELLALIEDFQQNQMATGDLSETQEALNKLAHISDKDMQPVIDLLREVSTSNDPKEVEKKLLAASQSQKNIHALLRKLADNLTMHRNQASMQQRLEQLILRQLTNIRQTREVSTGGKADRLRPEQAMIFQHCKTEQMALKTETDLAIEAIRQIVNGVPEAERPGFGEALKDAEALGVSASAERAALETMQGKWPEALAGQTSLHDGLQKMLLDLRAKQTASERVAAAKNKLEQLMEEQKRISDLPKDATPAAQKDQKETQKELTDKIAALQKEVEAVNAKSAEQLSKAKEAMEKADAGLEKSKNPKSEDAKQAEAAQKDAMAKMDAAKASLDKQLGELAKAEQAKQPLTAQQHVENLQKLKADIDKAAQDQKALSQSPTPNQQAQQKLADQAAQMQQQALPTNNDAAQKLGEAATAMQQPGKQADAQKALEQAGKQVDKQLEAAKQAQQLQNLANKISEAQQQAAAAGKSIQDAGKGPMDAAMKQTENAQKAVNDAQAQTQQQAQQNQQQQPAGQQQQQPGGQDATARNDAAKGDNKPAGTPAGVDDALGKANSDLAKSNLEAAQKKQAGAAAANKQAQDALAKAADAVGQALSSAMAEAGVPQQGQQQSGQKQAGQQPGKPQPGQPGQQQQGQPQEGQGQETANQMINGIGGDTQMSKNLGGPLASSGVKGGPAEIVTGLKPKDREAATLLQKEKAPAEYTGMSRQYMKNLAQGETGISGEK